MKHIAFHFNKMKINNCYDIQFLLKTERNFESFFFDKINHYFVFAFVSYLIWIRYYTCPKNIFMYLKHE